MKVVDQLTRSMSDSSSLSDVSFGEVSIFHLDWSGVHISCYTGTQGLTSLMTNVCVSVLDHTDHNSSNQYRNYCCCCCPLYPEKNGSLLLPELKMTWIYTCQDDARLV